MTNFLTLLTIITLSTSTLFAQTEVEIIYQVPLIDLDEGPSGSVVTRPQAEIVTQDLTKTEDLRQYQILRINSDYMGCCSPPVRSMNRCTPLPIYKVEKSGEEVLDITDPELAGLTASPNPTKGHLNVSIPANLIGYEIQIIDMTGRFVGPSIPITGTTEQLTIEGEAGVYLLSIRTEKETITERILLNTH